MLEVKQKRSRKQRTQDNLSWTLWIGILFSHNGRTARCWKAKPWWLICLSGDNAALYSLPTPTSQVQADSDFRQPGDWWCCKLRWVWSMFPWIAHHWRAKMGRVRWWVHIWKRQRAICVELHYYFGQCEFQWALGFFFLPPGSGTTVRENSLWI